MKKNSFHCAACGVGTVRPVAKAGRKERYKTMTLPIPATLKIPTCNHCGEEWFDDKVTAALEESLRRVYVQKLSQRAQRAIQTLADFISQRKLEELLGLSQGYLSHLRSGKKDPSPELVAHLTLLAHSPALRLKELERSWHDEGHAA